jgi:hypothetical protein
LRDLWWAPPAAIAGFALIRLDLAWTYAPIVIALLASAWLTVTGLTLVIVLAAFGLERKIASVRQLEPAVVAGAIAALAVIIGLAQLRFWLERTLGIPQDLVATVIVPLGSILP